MDHLTGAFNRKSFDGQMKEHRQLFEISSNPVSFIMMDIDFFKKINDTYGHLAGDDCLRRVAGALSGAVGRGGDLLCRYGGEEFAAVLPDTNAGAAALVAERMRGAVEALGLPHAGSRTATIVTTSLGAATLIPTEPGSTAELVACADRALYAAKHGGRNRVVSDGPSAASVAPQAH